MKFKSPFVLLLLVWALGGIAADDKSRPVEARIKFVAAGQAISVGIMQDKRLESFLIPSDMLTQEFVYRGPARLTLLKVKATAKPVDSKATPEEDERIEKRSADDSKSASKTHDIGVVDGPPLAWIDLPNGVGPLYLILVVNPGKDNGITAIADTPGSFPPGSNRYFNLCPFPLKVKLPSGEQYVAGKDAKVMRPGALHANYYDLVISSKIGEQELLAFSGRIFHMESLRKLYFITPGQGELGRVRLKVVEDRPAYGKPPITPTVAPKNLK
jgi:hypothetical protein